MKKFIIPEGLKSNVINGHVFKDGELIVSDEDGKKMQNSMCNFHGCQMEDVQEPEGRDDEPDDPGLSASNTKGSSDGVSSDEED